MMCMVFLPAEFSPGMHIMWCEDDSHLQVASKHPVVHVVSVWHLYVKHKMLFSLDS